MSLDSASSQQAAPVHRPTATVQGIGSRWAVSAGHTLASEAAGRVADRAVQIFGGRGYMRENVAERFYRELRVERIWEGTSEIQRVIIADQLRKRGAGPLVG